DVQAFRNLRADGVVLVGRDGDGHQDAEDRDHDHQFDQGKALLDLLHGVSPRRFWFHVPTWPVPRSVGSRAMSRTCTRVVSILRANGHGECPTQRTAGSVTEGSAAIVAM